MLLKRLVIAFSLLLMLSPVVSAEPFIKGIYTRVPHAEFKFDGKTVEVIEFLSFYCHACYNFERYIPVIMGNFPKKIKWKIVPIHWGDGSSKPAEAYLLAEEMGKGVQMKKALFKARFEEGKDIGNIKVLEDIGRKLGLGDEFSRRLKASEKAPEVDKGLMLARKYMLQETPTLIIAGNIMTDPHFFNHNLDLYTNNVLMIIKSILEGTK